MAPAAHVILSDADFQRLVLESPIPVLLHLYPDASLTRERLQDLEGLARDHEDVIRVVLANHDDPRHSVRVQRAPAYVIYRGGQPVAGVAEGVLPLSALRQLIAPFMPPRDPRAISP